MNTADSETCPACGSPDVVRGVRVGQNAESGWVGLRYQTAILLTGTEAMVADLCGACGVVVRLRVANPNRKWLTDE